MCEQTQMNEWRSLEGTGSFGRGLSEPVRACQSAVAVVWGAFNCPVARVVWSIRGGGRTRRGRGRRGRRGRGRDPKKRREATRQKGRPLGTFNPYSVCNDELALLLVDIRESTTGDGSEVARRTCPSRARGVPCSPALGTPVSVPRLHGLRILDNRHQSRCHP